ITADDLHGGRLPLPPHSVRVPHAGGAHQCPRAEEQPSTPRSSKQVPPSRHRNAEIFPHNACWQANTRASTKRSLQRVDATQQRKPRDSGRQATGDTRVSQCAKNSSMSGAAAASFANAVTPSALSVNRRVL